MKKYLSRVKIEDRGKELKPISDENLRDIYLEVMNMINEGYIEGTTKHIQEHNKQLDAEINKADDRVNEVWQECNKGEASLKDFEDALNTYQDLYLKAIDIKKSTILPTVEKLCKCGDPATTYDFGEAENGKSDWTFYCNSCNPHAIDCSECGSRAILYEDSSGKPIFDKCNVHGARLKVTHADIDALSRERERKRSYIT